MYNGSIIINFLYTYLLKHQIVCKSTITTIYLLYRTTICSNFEVVVVLYKEYYIYFIYVITPLDKVGIVHLNIGGLLVFLHY